MHTIDRIKNAYKWNIYFKAVYGFQPIISENKLIFDVQRDRKMFSFRWKQFITLSLVGSVFFSLIPAGILWKPVKYYFIQRQITMAVTNNSAACYKMLFSFIFSWAWKLVQIFTLCNYNLWFQQMDFKHRSLHFFPFSLISCWHIFQYSMAHSVTVLHFLKLYSRAVRFIVAKLRVLLYS